MYISESIINFNLLLETFFYPSRNIRVVLSKYCFKFYYKHICCLTKIKRRSRKKNSLDNRRNPITRCNFPIQIGALIKSGEVELTPCPHRRRRPNAVRPAARRDASATTPRALPSRTRTRYNGGDCYTVNMDRAGALGRIFEWYTPCDKGLLLFGTGGVKVRQRGPKLG